jgi:hypothetical protein
MHDLIFGSVQAYQQVGLFFGALVCFGLGALLLGNSIYWHLRGLRVTGTIIGVVNEGGTYAPVYRYTAADGSVHEAKSTIGTGTTADKATGRVVPLLVSRHDPSRAQEAGIGFADTVFVVAGLLLGMAGAWMGTTAITAYPLTAKTWIMAAFMIIYALWHFRRGLVSKGQRLSSPAAWWQSTAGNATNAGFAGVKPIEQIVSPADAQQTTAKTSQQWKKAAPFVLIFAVLLASFAVLQANMVARLQSAGLRAEGQVVNLKGEYSSSSHGGSYSYYPIVRYRTATNVAVEFKDNIGSNPPSYRVGDKVTVLYLPDSPRTQVMIDRGAFWNWALPGVLGAGAVLLFWLFSFLRRADAQAAGTHGAAPSPMRMTV